MFFLLFVVLLCKTYLSHRPNSINGCASPMWNLPATCLSSIGRGLGLPKWSQGGRTNVIYMFIIYCMMVDDIIYQSLDTVAS